MNFSNLGNYYEDFIIGETINHALSKTIFESDNNFFSLLTMNHHPLHLNSEYAQESQHGKIVVVGTLVLSLTVGISVPDISGKAIANLGYEQINHLNPVYINDTIYAKSTIIEAVPTKKRDRGKIKVKTVAYNQNGTAVLDFTRTVLVKRRVK